MTPLEELSLAVIAVWVLWLVISPWTTCPACNGTGKHRLSTRRAWGDCPFCKGRGKRLRFGARIVRRAIRRKERQ